MPHFSYKARRRSGEVVQGVLDVTDRSAALVQIERLGLLPVAVEAAKASAAAKIDRAVSRGQAVPTKAGILPLALREMFEKKRKPKLQELATFTQQLSN